MRTFGAFLLFGLLGLGPSNVNFDGVKPGTAPPGWTIATTKDDLPQWEIRYDPTAPSRGNVLERVAGRTRESESPVAVFDKVICADGDLSVKFRIDPAGRAHSAGVVWRYQDANNYYLLRFSADQKNIVLFRVRNGNAQPVSLFPEQARGGRSPVTAMPHDLRAGQWYVAKVIFRGPKIRVLFGNRRLFDAEDSSSEADLGPGKAGVYTRGRTRAAFDDFRIEKKS